jgi:hypothetical protein
VDELRFGYVSAAPTRWPFVALAALAGTGGACATIMSVEDATLDPSVFADASAEAAPAAPAVDACVGAGCACAVDPDCADPTYRRCVDGRCSECTTAPDSCAIGRYCLTGAGADGVNSCAPGCVSDDACRALTPSAPYCDVSRHQCVACRTKADCPGTNRDCSPAGVCADRCTQEGGECEQAGLLCCNQFCIDPKKDVLNCNGCGKACTGGETLCCDGTCKNPLTSADACGGCGNVCSNANASPGCANGSCTWRCVSGFNHCAGPANTGCETNIASSVATCGSCTNNCANTVQNAGGISCGGGQCGFASCNGGFGDCDGRTSNGCECACGKRTQVCCPGNVCDAQLSCMDGRCTDCGQLDKECCPGDRCLPNSACRDGRCRACLPQGAGCSGGSQCCSNDCDFINGSFRCR